jgi:hypothetical protein
MILQSHESELIGRWELKQGQQTDDATTRRIKWLLENLFVEQGSDPTGWDLLYRDPNDGRLWELTCPQSESHGGGPPRPALLDRERVREQYGHIAVG